MTKMLIAAVWFGAAAAARADLITFTADAPGPYGNGFVSVESPNASFTDTVGADLQVLDGGGQTIGQALIVFGDDNSMLDIAFSGFYNDLSIDFGNDDPSVAVPGDAAWLEVFNAGNSVGLTHVDMNLDDLMNQTININGVGNFDSARFWYGDKSANPINLIEAADNINFVPAPGTAGLLGLGALVARRRR